MNVGSSHRQRQPESGVPCEAHSRARNASAWQLSGKRRSSCVAIGKAPQRPSFCRQRDGMTGFSGVSMWRSRRSQLPPQTCNAARLFLVLCDNPHPLRKAGLPWNCTCLSASPTRRPPLHILQGCGRPSQLLVRLRAVVPGEVRVGVATQCGGAVVHRPLRLAEVEVAVSPLVAGDRETGTEQTNTRQGGGFFLIIFSKRKLCGNWLPCWTCIMCDVAARQPPVYTRGVGL